MSDFFGQLTPASLITFRHGVDSVLYGVHINQHSVSDSLFQSLTPTASMGRLCKTFGPHGGCSRKIKSEHKIFRRLEQSMHNSTSSKLFPGVTQLPVSEAPRQSTEGCLSLGDSMKSLMIKRRQSSVIVSMQQSSMIIHTHGPIPWLSSIFTPLVLNT